MTLHPDAPALLPIALGAIKAVATLRGTLHPTQRTMLTLVQRILVGAGAELDLDALATVDPHTLAQALGPSPARERVLRGMVLVCLARGEVSDQEVRLVEAYAEALGIDLHVVQNLRQLAEGHIGLLRFDVQRRAFTGQAIAQTVEEEGVLGLLRGAASRIGLIDDSATAERFEALKDLPEGTLGRALHDYYVRNGFPLPGRRHALPSFGVVHDLCHVLSGYGVDGPGELEVVAFQAGFMKNDPMSTVLFIVLQTHLNVRMVRIAPGAERMLDDAQMLERAMRAYKRGTAVRTDLFDHWDYAARLSDPIDAVRADLGVSPPDAPSPTADAS